MSNAAHPRVAEDPSRAPDLRLVAGAAASDGIERLVELRLRECRAGHLRFLCSRLRSREDAEDVLQDFSLKALQGAVRLTDTTKIDAWLTVTLRNALFDRYRRNAGRTRLREAVTAEPTFGAEHEPEANYDLEHAMACLSQAMAGLRPETAALLRCSELQETPLKAIAGDLGITANNVGVRVHRAREALRGLMQARCAACPAPCALAARFLDRCAA
jgi:RNA polymerase sigma factor (sigma-70 family)